jgi:protein-tyrosine phosphatase
VLARSTPAVLACVLLFACSDAPPLYQVELGATVAGAGGTSATAGSGGVGATDAGTGGSSGDGSGGTAGMPEMGGSGNGSCAPSTVVLSEDGIRNARDLGGIPLSGGRTVKCGLLFRGPPLELQNGCDNYDELGVRVIIDLRQPSETGSRMDAACATEDARVIAAPLPIPYQLSAENYIADLNTLDSMALVFHELGTEAGYPMYFHCTWGRDRTAVVTAVILSALGASREAIMTDYNISASTVGAYPASLEATLDELERRGGVEGYYAELGVTAEELAFLRDYATAP